ncbi:pyroglutamyl-peptidase I [Pseudalkalibacillus salsuginis]|uniref:pyroglutamyl-peptidase I n=1 Tax=Pseudalkalibacillus salsuginis TaxID=2910972 RepID=UPI001F173711|nr:pyroglutamyl-peptidase I [Pseudalkalibacillus salsuginis]MCF6410159.1 pyroglutamyl-peptidase I [Pseudalkalibacillus salsuginis]
MKKLLLTGFEPFLDHGVNPTELIVKALDGKMIGDYQVIGRVLPVEFGRSADVLLGFIQKLGPDAIISLGLAAGRDKITPERVAINVNDGVADNKGRVPVDEPIVKDGPDAYFSTLPIRQMVNALLENGIPAMISNSAGTYLCNNVMYSVRHYIEVSGKSIPAGFIHVPASFELSVKNYELSGWPLETIRYAVEIAVGELE